MHHDFAVLREVARAYLILASFAAATDEPGASKRFVARAVEIIGFCARRAGGAAGRPDEFVLAGRWSSGAGARPA